MSQTQCLVCGRTLGKVGSYCRPTSAVTVREYRRHPRYAICTHCDDGAETYGPYGGHWWPPGEGHELPGLDTLERQAFWIDRQRLYEQSRC